MLGDFLLVLLVYLGGLHGWFGGILRADEVGQQSRLGGDLWSGRGAGMFEEALGGGGGADGRCSKGCRQSLGSANS